MSNVLASGTSVLVVGLAVVFAVLIIIMVVTTILGALMKNVKDSAPAKATQAPAAAPAPAAPVQQTGGDSSVWYTLIEKYKDRVQPMIRVMLDDACGDLQGDVMVVHCGDDLTRDSLDCPPVAQVLCGVTGEYLGRSIQVRFIIGKADKAISGEDRLEALIRAGSKFDSFTVK